MFVTIENGKPVVRNDKGEQIVLNALESAQANYWQRMCNDLGYQVDITTLTTVLKRISEQKFFKIPPANYMPLLVGEGAWSVDLTKYRAFEMGGDFEQGIINTGGDNSRLAMVDSAVDSVNVKTRNWAKTMGWTIMDIMQASKSGNWDIVSSKEKSRKTNWDLGIQKVAFLGTSVDKGLLTQSTSSFVTVDTTLITKKISAMDATELSTFLAGLLARYRTNCNFTAYPTHFEIPETDYNGLAIPSSADFPLISRLKLIQETMATLTMNPNFKVLPCAYAVAANSGGALSVDRYVLLNYDEDSLAMYLPVDYTATIANSFNGFQYQNAAYGQFTGVAVYRQLELMYFDLTPAS